jgi:hypothetical protein
VEKGSPLVVVAGGLWPWGDWRAGRGGDLRLEGQPAETFGAGGGGVGAFGEGAIGGGGGEGGEHVIGFFTADQLPPSIEITIGAGGKGGLEGDGGDGGDTKFGDLLIARGGKAGRAGKMGEPRELDAQDKVRITSMYLADCAHLREGLLYLLSAGWENFSVTSVPVDMSWPFVVTTYMEGLPIGSLLSLAAVVVDPHGNEVSREVFTISYIATRPTAYQHNIIPIKFPATMLGVWSIRIVSGAMELASLPIEIKLKTE